MVVKEDKQRLQKVLLDAISLLCKNALPIESEFSIEATIGITLSESNIVLFSFKELIQPDARQMSAGDAAYLQRSRHKADIDLVDLSEDSQTLNCANPQPSMPVCKQPSTDGARTAVDNSSVKRRKVISSDFRNRSKHSAGHYSAFARRKADGRSAVGVSKISDGGQLKRRLTSGDSEHPLDELPNLADHGQAGEEFTSNLDGTIAQNTVTPNVKEEIIDRDDDCEEVLPDMKTVWEDDHAAGVSGDSKWALVGANESNCRTTVEEHCEDFIKSDVIPKGRELDSYGDSQNSDSDASFWDQTPAWTGQDQFDGSALRLDGMNAGRGGAATRRFSGAGAQSSALIQASMMQSADGTAVICQICGARLSSVSTLVKHIKGTHFEMSMCQCELCGEQFKWTMQLCRHRKRFHPNVAFSSSAAIGAAQMLSRSAVSISDSVILD